MHKSKKVIGIVICIATSFIAACGGGGGGGGNGPTPPPPPPQNPGPFTIGGAVSGLDANATGLVVTNNGTEQRAINANGTFAFTTTLPTGSSYDIRVVAQPYDPYQNCVVANGTGTVANAAITATITCTTLVSKFASSLDFNSASYSQYAVDASTGQLRQRGYVNIGRNPVDLGTFGTDAKISFVLSRGDAWLHSFRRDLVTGRVTEGANSPQTVDAVPVLGDPVLTGVASLTVHPKLPFVYVANGGDKTTVSGYRFDPETAALTAIPGSPFTGGQRPNKLIIDSTGRFAYLVNRDSASITPYTINQTTGALVANGSAVPSGGDTSTFPVIHPSGKFLYVPNGGSTTSSIAAFTIGASGALTAIAGSPFPMPPYVTAPIHFHPSGKYLFVKNNPPGNTEGSVTALAIDQTSGALSTTGVAVMVGISPTSFIAEPSGRYLFVANRGPAPRTASTPGSISVLRIDPATGGLTELPGIAANAPYSVNLDWSGKYLYSASAEGNVVRGYTFDVTTGALAPMTDTPELFVRTAPVSLLTIPSATGEPAEFRSKFAYVPDETGSRILAYSINGSGVVTPTSGAGPSAELANVRSVTVAPHARQLVAVNASGSASLRTFPINLSTGALEPSLTSAAGGSANYHVVAEPSGRFGYVADNLVGYVRGFRIDVSSGTLPDLPASPATPTMAFGMHPNGVFLYSLSLDRLSLRSISTTDGTLSSPVAGLAGGNNWALAMHPSGKFFYVARALLSGSIMTFRIRTSGIEIGEWEPLVDTTSSLGTEPVSITAHPTGRFVYVANTENVAAFRVSQSDGTLTAIGATTLASPPMSVRVDYSGKHLYVVDSVSQVLTFAINTTTGALTATAPTGPPAAAGELALSEDIQ